MVDLSKNEEGMMMIMMMIEEKQVMVDVEEWK